MSYDAIIANYEARALLIERLSIVSDEGYQYLAHALDFLFRTER